MAFTEAAVIGRLAFGLLHGLGYAGSLSEVGLPAYSNPDPSFEDTFQ